MRFNIFVNYRSTLILLAFNFFFTCTTKQKDVNDDDIFGKFRVIFGKFQTSPDIIEFF